MNHVSSHVVDTGRYAKCVEVSKRIRWEFERDVLRGGLTTLLPPCGETRKQALRGCRRRRRRDRRGDDGVTEAVGPAGAQSLRVHAGTRLLHWRRHRVQSDGHGGHGSAFRPGVAGVL